MTETPNNTLDTAVKPPVNWSSAETLANTTNVINDLQAAENEELKKTTQAAENETTAALKNAEVTPSNSEPVEPKKTPKEIAEDKKEKFTQAKEDLQKSTDTESIEEQLSEYENNFDENDYKKLVKVWNKIIKKLNTNSFKDKLEEMMPWGAKIAWFLALFGIGMDSKITKFIVGIFDWKNQKGLENTMIAAKEAAWNNKLPFNLDITSDEVSKQFKKLNKYITKQLGDVKLVPEAIKFVLTGKTDNDVVKKKFGTMQKNVATLEENASEDKFLKALQKPQNLAKVQATTPTSNIG